MGASGTGNAKSRHIKTFQEKYGIRSIRNEIDLILSDKKYRHSVLIDDFQELPHIGVAYIPVSSDFDELWYDCNTTQVGNMLMGKVIEVTDDSVSIATLDDHHKSIAIMTAKTKKYLLQGNVIIRNIH